MELIIEFAKLILIVITLILKMPFFYILFIISVLIQIFYPYIKGYIGEFKVFLELKKLPKNDYIILNNIMLKNNDKLFQIDHIVISIYGIFVIETKNYKGTIVGQEFDEKWTQYLGDKKYNFFNPIRQNYGHIKVLEELLELDNLNFIPIVCFSNNARLKINSKSIVLQLKDLNKNIKKFYKFLFDNEIYDLSKRLKQLNITDIKTRKEHIKLIKNKIKEDDEKIKKYICPKCGNDLIIKNSKYGSFLSCKNYPKCQFKSNEIL